MNMFKHAIQNGLMTARQANRHMAQNYAHDDFRPYPFHHITITGICEITQVWANRRFLVQEYRHRELGYIRLSINRTKVDAQGDWVDGITWDDLQATKSGVGYGDRYAVEIYPPDDEVVNVANIRHIVLLDEKPFYAWDMGDYRQKSRDAGFPPEDELEPPHANR